MAEQDYVRLAAACHCGKPVKLWSGNGRKPKFCEEHRKPPGKRVEKVARGCVVEGCGAVHQAHGYCIRHLRQLQRGGIRKDATTCAHCQQEFQPTHVGTIYCSKKCKRTAWVQANQERYKALPSNQPRLCAYVAKHCTGCGRAWGSRRDWEKCPACKKEDERRAAREGARAWGEAKHRAAGRVVRCDECGCSYCPLYAAKPGPIPLCAPCAKLRKRRADNAGGSNVQRAKRVGVPYRYFNERKVLERDRWTCQLCGIHTPKEARGSTRPDAPEFDHCIPLALGGPHIPENGQCLCRRCNGAKADNWCERSVERAKARGVRAAARPDRKPQDRATRRARQSKDRPAIDAPAPA